MWEMGACVEPREFGRETAQLNTGCERRRNDRIYFHSDVLISWTSSTGEPFSVKARAVNLSTYGTLVETSVPTPLKSGVAVLVSDFAFQGEANASSLKRWTVEANAPSTPEFLIIIRNTHPQDLIRATRKFGW